MALNRVYENLKRSFDNSDGQSPLEFKYINRLRVLLSTIGSWPYGQFGRQRLGSLLTVYNYVLSCSGTVTTALCGIYLWYYVKHTNNTKLNDMGHIILMTLLGALYLCRISIARTEKYHETLKDWLLEFHLYYFKSQSHYAAKISSQINIISVIFSVYVFFIMFFGLVLFNVQPWYANYSKGMFSENRPVNSTFENAVYFYFWTDKAYTTVEGYWMLFSLNIYISYNVTCGLFIFDLLLSLIVFQIWGHLRILKHNLMSFLMPAAIDGMYTSEENTRIRDILKENIVHHKLIINFVNKCSDAFSEYLLVLYSFLQLISCILLLEISFMTTEAFAKYGALTIGMHQQLIQVSVLFEMINTKSEELINAVYAVPWEFMDSKNRRTVMVLLHRVQTPLSLKAGKVVPVGVRTMTQVLKTSFSYYMMLVTIAKDK